MTKLYIAIHGWYEYWRRAAKTELGRDVVALYVAQGLNYLVPLLVLPYLLRILEPVEFGAIVFAQSLINYLRIVTNYGFNFSATREVALARERPQELRKIFWTTMAAKMCLLAGSLVIVVPLVFVVPFLRARWPVIGICGLALGGSILLPQWYFQGMNRIRELAIIQASSNVIMLLSTFVFVRSRGDELQAAGVLALPLVLSGIASLVFLKIVEPVRWYRPTLDGVREAIKSGWNLFVSGAATSLYVNSNVFFIGLLCGNYQVALYSLANRIALAATGVLSPIVQASFPRASVLFGMSVQRGLVFARKLSRYFLVISIVLSCILMFFARSIVIILGGIRYADAVPVVRVLALLPIAIGGAMILSQIVMINLGLSRRMSHIYIMAGLVSVALIIPLAAAYGAVGGAVALLIVEVTGPLLMLLSIRKWLRSTVSDRRAEM